MKVCKKCNIEKEEFRKSKKYADGFDSWCKECRRLSDKATYEKHIDKSRKAGTLQKSKSRERIKKYLFDYKSNNPCVDCGESDPIVLEFDHFRDKTYTISQMSMHSGLSNIKKEIAKCEIRCANCHRRKTAKDFKYYNNLRVVELADTTHSNE